MTIVPAWLDFVAQYNAAFRLRRNLSDTGTKPGEVLASAQLLLASARDKWLHQPKDLHDSSIAIPVTAAARMLDDLSSVEVTPDEDARRSIAQLAMVAYAILGNFPSAHAVSHPLHADLRAFPPIVATLVGICVPRRVGEAIAACGTFPLGQTLLSTLNQYLDTGSTEHAETLRGTIKEIKHIAVTTMPAFESALVRYSELALEQAILLATSRCLAGWQASFPQGTIRQLQTNSHATLLPPQLRAIEQGLFEERDSVVTLPTSTGKTLLGYLCLLASLKDRPGLACFIAPYRALARQVAKTFRQLNLGCTVQEMSGGFGDSTPLIPEAQRTLLIATPERFDALLRIRPELWQHLRAIVIDEAHIIGSAERGARVDGLIARFKMARENGLQAKIVMLMPQPARNEELNAWLSNGAANQITDTWRPTSKRLAQWEQNGALTWYVADSPIRRTGETSASVLGRLLVPWPNSNFPRAHTYPQVESAKQRMYENTAYMVGYLLTSYNSPVLCVCATRPGTRALARLIADRTQPLDPVPDTIARIVSLISAKYAYLKPLAELLKRSVAYHNAALPTEVCRLIEEACMARSLRAVVATTTLAEGVDLPFRFTVVADWLHWRGNHEAPIEPLLFHNIAGRCGRAGVYTEGDTILVDNPVGDAQWTNPYTMSAFMRDRYFSESRVAISSGAQVLHGVGGATTQLAAALASQFLAAIPENPLRDDLAKDFAKNMFWYHTSTDKRPVSSMFQSIRESVLNPDDGALAVAASPLRLTALGSSANKTGFSPVTCRALIRHLSAIPEGEGFATICSNLLIAFGNSPEQRSEPVAKMLAGRAKQSAKPEDLPQVIEQWIAGETKLSIFSRLPAVLRSTIQPPISEWLNGVHQSKWDDAFDKFSECIGEVFDGFLPWLLRACEFLASHTQGPARFIDWASMAMSIQHGVTTTWAMNAAYMDAPVDRRILIAVGQRWPQTAISEVDPLGLSAIVVEATRRNIELIFSELVAAFAAEPTLQEQVTRLRDWVWSKTWR